MRHLPPSQTARGTASNAGRPELAAVAASGAQVGMACTLRRSLLLTAKARLDWTGGRWGWRSGTRRGCPQTWRRVHKEAAAAAAAASESQARWCTHPPHHALLTCAARVVPSCKCWAVTGCRCVAGSCRVCAAGTDFQPQQRQRLHPAAVCLQPVGLPDCTVQAAMRAHSMATTAPHNKEATTLHPPQHYLMPAGQCQRPFLTAHVYPPPYTPHQTDIHLRRTTRSRWPS